MTNVFYRRGRAKEYRLKKKYEKEGFIVIRASGSHTFSDLVAIHPEKKIIKFIQSKPRKFSKAAKTRLEETYDFINNEYLCRFEVN